MTENRRKKYKESFFNLHFTSTISIALVLFMVGMVVSLYVITDRITRQSKENISVSLILNDTITAKEFTRLENYLNASRYTKEVVYISRDSALKEHISAIGEDPSAFLGYNPLSASLEVYLKAEYSHVDSIETVIKPKLSVFNGISDITYQKDVMQMLNRNVHKLAFIFSIIALILLFISIVLINNTIRLSIYSKRFIINTMQLVGANNSFIRRPFLKRAAINSAIAALTAIAMLCGAAYFIQTQIGTTFNIYQPELYVPVFGTIIILSIAINELATTIAVNRYLRMRTEQLYFI